MVPTFLARVSDDVCAVWSEETTSSVAGAAEPPTPPLPAEEVAVAGICFCLPGLQTPFSFHSS